MHRVLAAEQTVTDLPAEQQQLAMTLLLRMVTTASQGWTRRLVRVEDLLRLDGPVEEVLNHLVDRRLVAVRTDDATLSHESLVAAWPRLREAVEARRGDLARRETRDRAAQDWDAEGRGEDQLLRGARPARATACPGPRRDRGTLNPRHPGGTAYSWDTRGAVLPRLASNVFMVDASARGDRTITASGPPAGGLWVWDASDPHAPTLAQVLRAGGDDVSTGAGAVSADGRLAAMGTAQGRLLAWQIGGDEATQIVDVTIDPDGVPFVLFPPGGESVLGFGLDGLVQRIGLGPQDRGEVLGELEMPGAVMTAALRDDGLLATADDEMSVHLQRIDDLETTLTGLEPGALVYGMDFSPDGQVLAMSLSVNTVQLYDVSDPAAPAQLGDPLTGPTSIPNSVKFSPDGQRLAVATIGGRAWIYERQDAGWVATEVLRAGLVNLQDVAWSADGTTLLGGGLSGRTRLWLTDVEEAALGVCAGVGEPVSR